MKKYIAILILLLSGLIQVKSQELFNYDSLSIYRVLQFGLKTNFNIRLKQHEVGESLGQLTSTKGVFNPQLSLTAYGFYGTDPTVTFMDSYSLNGQVLIPTRLGLKFYTGFKLSTETEIISGVPKFFPSTNMPINESGMWAGVSIPLMRDLGKHNSNNAAFLSSALMNRAQNVSFNDEVSQFIRSTLTYYYNTFQRVRVFEILRDANKDANQYLVDIQLMIEDEQIPKAEEYRAKAYAINIHQQFSEARNQITNSLYDLVTSVGTKGMLTHGQLPLFLDSLPDPAKFSWDTYAAYVIANMDSMVVNTSYYKSQELATSATLLQMQSAKYNKLNDLNLDVRYMYFGTTSYQPFSDFNQTFTSGSPGSSVNLTLAYKIPFKNEERKGDYLTKLSSYEFNKTQLERVKFDSKSQVYQLISDLGNLIPLYKTQVELAEIEDKTWHNEVEKFKMGTSTQINVINTYMDFNTALLNVENSRQVILTKIILLKYLIGDFPTSTDQLLRYNLWDLSVK